MYKHFYLCSSSTARKRPSIWRQSSAVPRSSRQQVPRRRQEVCIFQGGPNQAAHCQFGRGRSGEVIVAAGSQTRPATDCTSTCRSTYRRMRSVHRDCEEAGPVPKQTRRKRWRYSASENLPLQSNVWSTQQEAARAVDVLFTFPQAH